MTSFKRDMDRYIVIKASDLRDAPIKSRDTDAFDRVLTTVHSERIRRGKPPLQCVVVEFDWPEYERVWSMIEARVTGNSDLTARRLSDADIQDLTWEKLGKWPSFEAQSWACKVAHVVEEKLRTQLITLRTYPVLEKGEGGSHEFAHRNAAVNECAAIMSKHGFVVNYMERGGPNITHIGPTLKMLGLDGEQPLETSDCCDGSGCKPTEEEKRLLSEGDYCAEELWGGKRPTCPNCLAKDLNQSFPLPDWAVSLSDGTLQVGLQLCTKDGRRCGNGHIVDFEQKNYQCVDGSVPIYAVLTDAGNTLHLMESEIDGLFYRGQFVSDPAEVISKFSRNTKS